MILQKIEDFLEERGMEINPRKTKITHATDGFDFLGWNFRVQKNGKFRSIPSEENYLAFRKKIKAVVNNSNYGAKVKAKKLAPIVRGWRNYHKFCKMDGSRHSLWYPAKTAERKFRKEKKIDRYESKRLVKEAFPTVPYSQNRHVMVKGIKSPYDGDLVYWSKRNSKLYNAETAKALARQNHTCECCGLRFMPGEDVELHHVDGNHNNWKGKNLTAVHRSCHQYIHMGTSKRPEYPGAG